MASSSNSVTNSPISHPVKEEQDVSSVTVPEKVKEEVVEDPLDDMESQQIEKFKRYAVESRGYLMSKYFSDKTIFGGNIFDVKMVIDGETIKASRFPGYQSYADPANFKDGNDSEPNSTVETPSHSLANGKLSTKKDY